MTFQIGHPKPASSGRQPNSPNKLTKALKAMILGALDEAGGQAYLTTQAKENPVAFMTLLGKVLPTTLAGDPENPIVLTRINLVPVEPRTLEEVRLLSTTSGVVV